MSNAIGYSNYNADGDLGKITYPTTTAENLSYTYDAADNLKGATYAGPFTGSDTWNYNDDEEQQSTTQFGQASAGSDSYNNYKQVTQASYPTLTGSASDAYSVAPNGMIQSDTPSGGSMINYTYKPHSAELTNQSNPNVAASVQATTYAYNDDGQRCWSNASSSFATNPTCGNVPSGATSYQWNTFGQLCWSGPTTSSTSCSATPAGATSYTYNGDGLRMTETPSTGSGLKFSWDTVSGGSIPEVIDDGTNAYIYGSLQFGGAAPVEQINLSTGVVSYLSSIPEGVQEVLNTSGSSQEQATYSPYGIQTVETGSQVTPYGFQGSYVDASHLIYLVNRYYDPSTDQFLSVDPKVSTTLQPYTFTGDDPLNATDELGLSFFNPSWAHSLYRHARHAIHRLRKAAHRAIHRAVHYADNVRHWTAAHKVQIAETVAFVAVGIATDGAGDAVLAGVEEGAEAEAAGSGVSDAVEACAGNSFTSNTEVRLADGAEVPLDQLKIGDKVLATDLKTGETQAEPITAVMVNYDHDLLDLKVHTSVGDSVIHTTQHHLIYDLTTRKWTEAEMLRPGDHLYGSDSLLATVVGSQIMPGAAYMWDLTVNSDHDFYVSVGAGSQTAVLVHNCPVRVGSSSVPDDSDLGQAVSRGMRTTTDENQVMSDLADNKDADMNEMSENLHSIKGGGDNNPDVIFSRSGDVYDNTSGDLLGNLMQR